MELEKMITLEVTDYCNLNCKMCIQSRTETPHGMPKGFMTFETWKAFIHGLERLDGPKTITPFWVGEPLLNPSFLRMMEYAFEHNENNKLFNSVTINTNGVLLTRKLSRRFLRLASLGNQEGSSFRRIHISIDAIKQDTFYKIKKKHLLHLINKNLLSFLKQRESLGLHYPNVTIAFIVMEENKAEARDFLDYWSRILKRFNKEIEITYDWPRTRLDSIYIRRLDDWDNQGKAEMLHKHVVRKLGLLEKDETRIIRTNSVLGFEQKYVRRPCPGLWRTPIIHRNGAVSVCCFDVNMKNVIGNLNETPLYQLWDSELINKWRVAHIKGEFDKAAPLCGACGNLFGPVLTDKHIIQYLKSRGMEDMIPKYLKRVKSMS